LIEQHDIDRRRLDGGHGSGRLDDLDRERRLEPIGGRARAGVRDRERDRRQDRQVHEHRADHREHAHPTETPISPPPLPALSCSRAVDPRVARVRAARRVHPSGRPAVADTVADTDTDTGAAAAAVAVAVAVAVTVADTVAVAVADTDIDTVTVAVTVTDVDTDTVTVAVAVTGAGAGAATRARTAATRARAAATRARTAATRTAVTAAAGFPHRMRQRCPVFPRRVRPVWGRHADHAGDPSPHVRRQSVPERDGRLPKARVRRALSKAALVAELRAQLAAALDAARRAHAAAIEGATHTEARAENAKDTRGLEQSYLARGQAQRVAELEAAVAELAVFAPRAFAPDAAIALGALITADEDGAARCWFVAPHGGGSVVAGDVQVVTPSSPLGRALLGKRAGDDVEIKLPGKLRALAIAEVA
jgi:transcription elongation GreA/GreB family factor